MPNRNKWEMTRSNILAAQVPADTRTYTAIPHRVFLEELSAKLQEKDYVIRSEEYMGTKSYQAITGSFVVDKRGNLQKQVEIAPTIYFVNSYNKTRRAIIRAGAKVLVCKNGMMGTIQTGAFSTKHVGGALDEFRLHMDVVIDSLEEEFKRLETNVAEMKSTKVDKGVVARLVGEMAINENLITATQLGILKNEIQYSKTFNDGSLWSFYNNCTEAFKDTHPYYYDVQHIKLHTFLSDWFSLTGSRKLYDAAPLDDNALPFVDAELEEA